MSRKLGKFQILTGGKNLPVLKMNVFGTNNNIRDIQNEIVDLCNIARINSALGLCQGMIICVSQTIHLCVLWYTYIVVSHL